MAGEGRKREVKSGPGLGLSSSYVFFTHSTRQAKDINVSRNGIKWIIWIELPLLRLQLDNGCKFNKKPFVRPLTSTHLNSQPLPYHPIHFSASFQGACSTFECILPVVEIKLICVVLCRPVNGAWLLPFPFPLVFALITPCVCVCVYSLSLSLRLSLSICRRHLPSSITFSTWRICRASLRACCWFYRTTTRICVSSSVSGATSSPESSAIA